MRVHSNQISLRQWRIDRQLSLEEFSKQIDLSLWQLHRLETGKLKRIDLRDALRIEEVTKGEIPPRALLG